MAKLNQKEFTLLEFLESHSNEYLTSAGLSEVIDVSDRTARKYLKNIKLFVEMHGAFLEIKKGSGYRLKITNEFQYINEVKRPCRETPHQLIYMDDRTRKLEILNQLLFKNAPLTLKDVKDHYFISDYAARKLMEEISEDLKNYNLKLEKISSFSVEGKESDKRRFMLDTFWRSNCQEIRRETMEEEIRLSEEIFIIVLEKCRENHFMISDYELKNLVLHLTLSIIRLRKGYKLPENNKSTLNSESNAFKLARQILKELEKKFKVKFSQEEIVYTVIHLKTKSGTVFNHMDEDRESVKKELVQLLYQISSETNFKLFVDHQLLNGLMRHVGPLLNRLKYNVSQKNPILDKLKHYYPDELKLTQDYLSSFSLFENYNLSGDEWAYIAIHLLASNERYQAKETLNVTLICSTGLGTAQMLKSRLENEYRDKLNIENIIGYYQLSEEIIQNTDLIISTIDLSNLYFSVPVINVSVFLEKEDIQAINRFIEQDHKVNDQSEDINSNDELLSLMKNVFDCNRFFVFKNESKEDILKTLTNSLSDTQKDAKFATDFMQQLKLRENFGAIVFKDDVAMPHPAKLLGTTLEIAVGIVPEGVRWDKKSSEVKIIILLSPSRFKNEGIEMINDRLINFIQSNDKKSRLLKQPTFDHFIELFTSR